MREVLRRIVAAVCLYGGIALCLTVDSGLYQIEPIDWNREVYDRQQQSQQITGMMGQYLGPEMVEDVDLASNTRGTIDEFIAEETEGRLIDVSGSQWEGLWNDIAATVQDRAPSKAWAQRRGQKYHEDYVYLPSSARPLKQLAATWPQGYLQTYVRIKPVRSTARPQYLSVSICGPSCIRDGALTHIVYPYRTLGASLLLSGLLFYILVPRRPTPETGMFYQARAAGWLPDFLAAFGSGAFFGLPFLITSDTAGGPLSSDWWPLTFFMWAMAGLFASIFVITTWYQTRRVTWDNDGISVGTWGKSPQHFLATEIESIDPFTWKMPTWLRYAAWIISIFNWRATSSAILLERSDPGFQLAINDGTTFCFTGDGLYGADGLLKWIDAHEIPVNAEARELMKTKSAYECGKAGTIVGTIFAVLTLGAGTPFLLQLAADAMPQPEPQYRDASFESKTEFVQPIRDAKPTLIESTTTTSPDMASNVVITPEVLQREAEIIEQIKQIRDELRGLQSEIGTVSNPNAEVIEKVQTAMQQLTELQAEFDAVRGTSPSEKVVPESP
ncbi:hypothetical protein [Aporhodopirellula aestuarii]|uniref:Uncharacterized protein n=1 Tax=Aporhodopirellula aestuarii TaxID=2950107 RepID=A0ABT0U5U9_9BACT|nr:hypothetical protein [Aporhodopirellula aestuarii]MCM2372301.1 hypothetical protein [Aporhodopirellula aestuarii]